MEVPHVPSKLSTDQKEEVIRLYYCPLHHFGATGNVNSCPMCVRGYIKRHHGADVFEHTPVHIAPDYGLGPAVCGVKRPFTGATNPRRVTCPDCLIVDYFNQEGVTNPVDNWEPAPLPPKPEPGRIIGYHCSTHNFHCTGKMALQLHVNGTSGECAAGPVREDEEPSPLPPKPESAITLNQHDPLPMYEHDCRDCIFLGTETVGGHEHDLYFHPDKKVPTVIARESSEGGDYRSGLDFVDRDGALALAYVRALRRGLLTTK